MRLNEALNLFLHEYPNTETRRSYCVVLNQLLQVIGPSRRVRRVHSFQLDEYIHDLYSPERDLSHTTVQKHIKTIKTFFNWMQRRGVITNNPAQHIRQKKLPKSIEKSKAMTDEELAAILDYFKYNPRNYAIIMFLADTGCRVGGLVGLRFPYLHLDDLTADVMEKGSKRRPVAFGEATRAALAAWLRIRPPCDYDHVFIHRRKKPFVRDSISLLIRRACREIGIRPLGGHSLRHRKGHQMADAGVAPSVAAIVLGHSDPTITLQYYYPHDWDRAKNVLTTLALPEEPTNVIQLRRRRPRNR